MKTHAELVQGSAAWLAHRREHFNASDAPAMMGCSPYKTRSELLHELATGIVPEVSPDLQRRYDDGHRYEALARPLGEAIVGEDFYPVVGTEGKLSASFDGLTMTDEIAFEHKSLNADLRAVMVEGCTGADLPMVYQVQMEQQCMVAGCSRVLFMASKWAGDKLVEKRHCWYEPNAELAGRIRAGWEQFAADLEAYMPPKAEAPAAVAATITALPALVVSVEGRVISSNLAPFRVAAEAFLSKIKTDLSTDQDFADAALTVKFCEEGEQRLELVKKQTLGQMQSVDELVRTIDSISEQLRAVRLKLDKAVTTRKVEIRAEIVAEMQKALDAHHATITARLGAPWIARKVGDFGDAMKGKKTVQTAREAAAVALANAKIDMSALADKLDANRKSLVIDDRDWFFLFADFAHVGNAPAETFSAVAAQRIQKHKDEEKAAADRAAVAAAAAAEKSAEPSVAIGAPAPAPAPAAVHYGRAPVTPLRTAAPAVDTRPPITTGALCEFLQFTVNADFVKRLGITPAVNPTGAKSGTYWSVRDLPAIKAGIVRHLEALPDAPVAAVAREAVPA